MRSISTKNKSIVRICCVFKLYFYLFHVRGMVCFIEKYEWLFWVESTGGRCPPRPSLASPQSIHNSGAKNLAIWHLQKSLYLFYLFTPIRKGGSILFFFFQLIRIIIKTSTTNFINQLQPPPPSATTTPTTSP